MARCYWNEVSRWRASFTVIANTILLVRSGNERSLSTGFKGPHEPNGIRKIWIGNFSAVKSTDEIHDHSVDWRLRYEVLSPAHNASIPALVG